MRGFLPISLEQLQATKRNERANVQIPKTPTVKKPTMSYKHRSVFQKFDSRAHQKL